MKQTIHLHDFRDAFEKMERGTNFSYEGLEVLFDYLEELEHCEDPYELDVIALCCDFSESDALTIANDYNIDTQGMDDDEITKAVREHLEDEGALVGEPFEGSFLYRNF